MTEHHHNLPEAPMDPERLRVAQRCTWISVVVNVVLVIAQVSIGLMANAQSLVADGMHSASDLLADFMVLMANRQGSHPADSKHPYGHGRIETAASLLLGLLLVLTGGGMLLAAGSRLQDVESLPPVQSIAFWVAVATLLAKEGLFRYMLVVAERLRSPMMVANAWHARADAASSLVVAAGIAGSLMGYRFLDCLAAALVGFLIVRMGFKFTYEAMQELVDTGMSSEEVAAIRATVVKTSGVVGLHELRTRRMGHQGLVDVHVRVASYISVSEGHRIAEDVRQRVIQEHDHVLDVLVHVDVEDDLVQPKDGAPLPQREALLAQIEASLQSDAPLLESVTLHYLANRVELDVVLRAAAQERSATMATRVHAALEQMPGVGSVRVCCRVAP